MQTLTRAAVITGSTRGIGFGLAQAFAKAGYAVMLNGLEENGDEIAAQMAEEFGVPVRFSPANLRDPEAAAGLVHDAHEAFGRVDVLINNAGIQHVSPVKDFPLEKWQAIMDINLSSAFYTTKAAWPLMEAQKSGRIINIASAHGLRASAYKSAYVAAKHGIVGLTKVLALEGAGHNITANAICPGYVRTPLVEGQIKDQAAAHGISEQEVITKIMLAKHAVKEFVPESLLAEAALFFAREDASTLTGIALPIEGGWTAQ